VISRDEYTTTRVSVEREIRSGFARGKVGGSGREKALFPRKGKRNPTRRSGRIRWEGPKLFYENGARRSGYPPRLGLSHKPQVLAAGDQRKPATCSSRRGYLSGPMRRETCVNLVLRAGFEGRRGVYSRDVGKHPDLHM